MTVLLHILYPELPPSSNKLYWGNANNRRLTSGAKKYAESFSYHVTRNHLSELQVFDNSKAYALHLRFYFPTLINANFYDSKPARKNKAGAVVEKTRFKKMDLSNRIKLLEDCIRDVLGVDDSHTFASSQEKHHSPVHGPRGAVEILVQEVVPELFGVPPIP